MATSTLVVKHTFLEFDVVGERKARARCNTTPAQEWFSNVQKSDDVLSVTTRDPDSRAASPDMSAESSPRVADASEPVFLVSATPEASPVLCAQLPPRRERWADYTAEPELIEPICGLEAFTLEESHPYNGQPAQAGQGWWVPMPSNSPAFHRSVDISFGHYPEPPVLRHSPPARRVADEFLYHSILRSMSTHPELNGGTANRGVVAQTSSMAVDMANETRTTVMIRNLPESFTRPALFNLLNAEGFCGRFDFLYLPIDFKRQVSLGYAFVNLISPSEAQRFSKHFAGFSGFGVPADAACTVNWSDPHQGLESHVERYRNSPVMHHSVPEDWRPMLFKHGVQVPFPPPTKAIKAPKVKKPTFE